MKSPGKPPFAENLHKIW